MKAAVLHQLGGVPAYEEFSEPVPQHHEQLLMSVKAAAIKNIDKLRASGKHYASYTQVPVVVGIDGVGVLPDGRRVYAQGITGMIAEKALVKQYVPLPDHIDDVTAAALPNAVIGAAMAIEYRAGMKKGEVILVNGATGVTGQLAVQLAVHYGASKIIVTGRNPESLEKLKQFGAHEIISLNDSDESVVSKLKAIHAATPIDVVIDYLWGRPVELIITALKGGGIDNITHRTRLVTVGGMAGDSISVSSSFLRSTAVELLGSGIGSLSREEMMKFGAHVLPEMFKLAAEGKLSIDTEVAPLKDIEAVWNKETASGKRLVITM